MSKIALSAPVAGAGTATIQGPETAADIEFQLPPRAGQVLVAGPAFSAYRSNSTQAINTVVAFDVERFDFGNGYDPATGRFQPAVAGIYLLTAVVRYVCTGSANILPAFRLNGSVYFRGDEIVGGTGNYQASLTTHIQLNGSTDYVDVYAYGAGSCSLSSTAPEAVHTFSGHLVRPA